MFCSKNVKQSTHKKLRITQPNFVIMLSKSRNFPVLLQGFYRNMVRKVRYDMSGLADLQV